MFKNPLSAISDGVKSVLKGESKKSLEATKDADGVTIIINGISHTIKETDEKFGPESRLIDFIRDGAKLKGTKWMCREGGCGACVVTVRTINPHNGDVVVRAMNSCLAPVWGCDGYDISTIEDLGNKKDGYHPIQKRLADFGGTQCGYCSPGMVMNMYALANSKSSGMTCEDIEDSFDGNLCRCTGYRPIMDAMKSFAIDPQPQINSLCLDIEDFCAKCPEMQEIQNKNKIFDEKFENGGTEKRTKHKPVFSCCSSCSGNDGSTINLTRQTKYFLKKSLTAPSGQKWITAVNLKSVFEAFKNFQKNKYTYRVVAGNTGTGVFKNDGPYDAFIDVKNIPELNILVMKEREAVLGAGTTLTKTIEFFENLSNRDGFGYAGGMAKHLKRVANTPVRNLGTIAGNLMLKHTHKEFPSDVLMLLETIGAKIVVASSPTATKSFSPWDFLQVDMRGQLILQVTLPIRDVNHVFRSYKITKRFQNAHAYVNAGFLFKVDPNQNFKILERPTITFGGIRPEFLRAFKTEEVLNGVELKNLNSLKKALKVLESEVEPDEHLPDASPEYRKALTLSLLYKTVLGLLGEKGVTPNVRSGGIDLQRKLHSGQQFFDKNQEKDSPLYKPVHKIEGLYQVSGEAEYINDIPRQDGELFGTFVTAEVAPANLKNVDASEALKIPGVVTFLTVKDIPGKNSIYNGQFNPIEEELFVENKINSSGQAIGLILAETQQIANLAASKVKVEYENRSKPLLDVKDGVEMAQKNGTFNQLFYPIILKTTDGPSRTSKYRVKGQFKIGGQAHIHMETHITLAIPGENLQIYSASQWPDLTQGMIASILGISNNLIDIQVRRLGGAYGAKINRNLHAACGAALGAHVTGKPVRLSMDFESQMQMEGGRLPYYAEYEVGFNEEGKIDGLDCNMFCDIGMLDGDGTSIFAISYMQNCYSAHGWILKPGRVITNTHLNTFCRAPGTTQGIAVIEQVMEHIADTLKMDSMDVRQVNYLQNGDDLIDEPGKKFKGPNLVPSLVEEMKKISNYGERQKFVEEFNSNNRWKKRGLSMVSMRYHQDFHGVKHSAFVGIHNQDGTVSVSHGGIEMGQGINTKVAQVVAHELGIPMSKIVIKPTNNLVGMNSDFTGGSVTSELTCYAAMRACEIIKKRIKPIKEANLNLSWEELIKKCYMAGVDLRASHFYNPGDPVKSYDTYGCNLTEVEIDVLTGEMKIVRLDLIEDAGKSLSPAIDLGQIEGSTIMGIGLWTSEKLQFDPETGRLLTRNTWDYKPPFPKCTPEDMRITIMRKSENPFGVLRSKATGEPPLCLSVAVLFAIKNAIKAARKDAGSTDWFQLDGPVTPEDILRLSLTDPHSQFVF